MDLRKPADLDDTLAAMADMVERSALVLWLTNHDPTYAYKARELRTEVAGWLSYIPNTFPHYTRHTIDHSEEIICQISNLLFSDGNPDRLVVPDLTPVEAYILVASSYLHDVGMVASEREKAQILSSAEWTEWTRSGNENARRLDLIDQLRSGSSPSDPTVRHFLADSQLRLLIAEFVRRIHHERAADVLEAHQAQLGRFAFDDRILASAISLICVAHGLPRSELEDRVRFPQETDIRGDKVNLQFCAIVLRLGDLLDLRTERACPLLLSAACPLPTESIAHWKQYERIRFRNTAPDRIEIRAACENSAEHRTLRDWCKWIEDETIHARELMPRSRRHSTWKPPIAKIGPPADSGSTIIVEPSPAAKYVPEDWRFILDEEIVFDRLIRDVYTSPWDFLRELVQNALDAVRCRMSQEMMSAGEAPPEDLRDAPEDWRSRYPIVVRRESIATVNEHSGKEEQRDVLVVEDSGIGMSREVIQKFLLQVGRSWYESPEFKRRFTFTPTSQFGLGFLSVFGVSRRVEVETHRPDSGDGPLRLVLQGPRNYLLVEKGELEFGTRVSVHLDHLVGGASITEMVSSWCRRAEFPIAVSDGESAVTIRAEAPTQFLTSQRDPEDPELTYKVLCFPFKQPGVDGELYVLALEKGGREFWDMGLFAAEERSKRFPMGQVPQPPPHLVCLNGLSVVERGHHSATDCYRVDCRSSRFRPTLSRRSFQRSLGWQSPLDLVIGNQWASVLRQHLAEVVLESPDDRWRYHQRLARKFAVGPRPNLGLQEFWSGVDSTIPRCELGHLRPCSLGAIRSAPGLWFLVRPRSYLRAPRAEADRTLGTLLDAPYICWEDAVRLCDSHATQLFGSRSMMQIRRLGESAYAVRWSNGEESRLPFERDTGGLLVESCHQFALPNDLLFGVKIPATRLYYRWIVLNSRHPLASWCIAIAEKEWSEDDKPLGPEAGSRLRTAIVRAFDKGAWEEFNRFIDAWASAPDLPPDLIPPVVRLSQESIADENRIDWCN